MSEEEIKNFVERAAGGDAAAVAALYDSFAPRVYRFFRFRVAAGEAAEDLMQKVFLKMVEQLPSYRRTEVPFAAWLFRVARNAWIDENRTHHPTVAIESLAGAEAAAGDPESIASASLDGEEIRRAVAALPADQREVIACRFFAELSPRETAELMGRSEGSVRVLQHRALARLKRGLPRLNGAPTADLGAG
jgi:RNA polymerase sigma-70 factor (ECF subfamily)